MRKGHTIIELLVAMGLLIAIMAGSGKVFHEAISAHRTANATAEISQKLQAITTQLDADFAGLRKDAPFAAWFTKEGTDQIMFFADGNFEAYNTPLTGNLARIYYGAANRVGWNATTSQFYIADDFSQSKLLARRQHICTSAGPYGPFPDSSDFQNTFFVGDPIMNLGIDGNGNNVFEYETMSLGQWQAICGLDLNNDVLLATVFGIDSTDNTSRPNFSAGDGVGLHTLMSDGIAGLHIQFAYRHSSGIVQWWPSEDPDGDGDTSDSDFDAVGPNPFGYHTNMPGGDNSLDWYDQSNWFGGTVPVSWPVLAQFGGSMPVALKITFTLYDSAGIFKDGKTFSHIVYLAD